MTDTVVRIEAIRYGLLEFATLVVHNTQGIAADSLNNARPCWRKGVSSHIYYACWPSVLVVGSSGSCKLVVKYGTTRAYAMACIHTYVTWHARVRTYIGRRMIYIARHCVGARRHRRLEPKKFAALH